MTDLCAKLTLAVYFSNSVTTDCWYIEDTFHRVQELVVTNIFLQLKYIQLRSTKVQLLCFVGRLLKTITKRASVYLCGFVCVCMYWWVEEIYLIEEIYL